MEWTALGGAAALSELLRLLKSGVEVCHSIWTAPAELQEATLHHSLLCDETALLLRRIGGARKPASITDEDGRLLARYVRQAQKALAQIEGAFAQEVRAPSFANRVRWGLLGRKKVNFLMTRLARIETSINLALQLVSMNLEHIRFEKLLECLSLGSSYQYKHHADSGFDCLEMKQESRTTNESVTSQLLTSDQVCELKTELRTVQSHASAITYGRLVKPGDVGNLGLTLFNGMSGQLQSSPTSSASVLVSHNSDIMVASRAGDVRFMSQIISKIYGIQNSRTLGNLTPMCFAVESGSTEAVQLLLRCNVHVDSIFGKRDTTALGVALNCRQLEIAKVLINAGASFYHRNIWGWTPIFYLWMREERNPSASELLTLLWAHRDFHLLHEGIYDASGWGVMHRAAVYGSAEDIPMLIAYGLDPFQRMRQARKEKASASHHDDWSVLQLVVYHGALDSFEKLLPYYMSRFDIEMRDSQGWTLLHIAIERGHLDIARILLEHGANAYAKTKPTLTGVPGDTAGHRYTPLSLAWEVGPEYFEEVCGLIEKTSKSNSGKYSKRSFTICYGDYSSNRQCET